MDQATTPSTTPRPRFHPTLAVPAKAAFIDQLVTIDQSQSLIDYVNRFKTENTVIFAAVDELEVHAVIDYHAAASAEPGLVEHRAILSLAYSNEWSTWNAFSGRMYDQKAFARLLNVNSDDIAFPASATLLELNRKLRGPARRVVNTPIASQTDDVVLPAFITLSIPLFSGEAKVDVKAMINTGCNRGKISLGVELVRSRILVATEMERISRAIATATSVPVIMGSVRD